MFCFLFHEQQMNRLLQSRFY